MQVDIVVNPHFDNYLTDWHYETYLLVGGYGSGKSYETARKIILKCLEEKRKVLVVREVYSTIGESCFDLFCEILNDMGLLGDHVRAMSSPYQIRFKNGSKIIFKGMDKPVKLKSINDVSIVWVEEAPEVKYAGIKELEGRLRHPTLTMHFIYTANPVDEQDWIYERYFIDEENDRIIVKPETFYEQRILVKNGVYYHHSTVDDNKFAPEAYRKRLDDLQTYDPDLYRVARHGKFGSNGLKVLPQLEIIPHSEVMKHVNSIPSEFQFNGMDFGFAISYNAIVRMAVDDKEKILYIYDEYYKNKMTDDKTLADLIELGWDKIPIIADSAEPKTISYFEESGCDMRGAVKYQGSRLENTKKLKRFKRIVVSSSCRATAKEWKSLTYAKDARGKLIYDKFNIDAHTFSAAWYGLDLYDVADVKELKINSLKGH